MKIAKIIAVICAPVGSIVIGILCVAAFNTVWKSRYFMNFPQAVIPGASKETVQNAVGEPLAKWDIQTEHDVKLIAGHFPGFKSDIHDSDETEVWTYSAPKHFFLPYFMRDITFETGSYGVCVKVESKIDWSILTAKPGVD